MLNVTSELGTFYTLDNVTCALHCSDMQCMQYGMPRVVLCNVNKITLKLKHCNGKGFKSVNSRWQK